MVRTSLILITGRSTRQGTGVSTGKGNLEYQEVTSTIELNEEDMARSGIRDGKKAVIKSEFGEAEVTCRQADIPEGLAFMAFGPACNRLVGGETHASGMPSSKHLEIQIEPV